VDSQKIKIALSCLFWLLAGSWADLCHADTIYFYKDKHGVFHFTDTPQSYLYRPFLFLRDRTSKADKSAIVRYVEQYGRLHGVNPHLIMAVIEVESAFNPTAVSRVGAQGLMQIMPKTQQDLGLTTPFDARDNIEAGIRYLRMLMDRFPSLPLALAAYNAGPGAVERYRGIPPFPETRDYVRRVMANYDRRRSAQN
jgi:soluble lytic murein transglycosylase-like protein